jgi:hypothetical protein
VSTKEATGALKLERRADGQLLLRTESGPEPVSVCSCFPWTAPSRYISLRDAGNRELALVDSLDHADGARQLLEDAVADAGFTLEIIGIESVEEEVEIRNWKVTTRQGPRTFQTKVQDWPRRTPTGALLVRDVAGDLFSILNPEELDEKSRAILWSYAD